MLRRRPLLHRVPRVGSPASTLVLRRSDFSHPGSLSSPPHYPFRPITPEVTRSPRFLGNPYAHATSQGPRRGQRTRTPGTCPAIWSRCYSLPLPWKCRPPSQGRFRGLPPWPTHPLFTLRSRPHGAGHAKLALRRRSSASDLLTRSSAILTVDDAAQVTVAFTFCLTSSLGASLDWAVRRAESVRCAIYL
jgi:hypothetical protein